MSESSILHEPVTALKGVAEAQAEKLAKLGILKVADLLFHLPLRYQDRTRVYPISELRLGTEVQVEGWVERCDAVFRSRRMLLCEIADDTGRMTLRFFYFGSKLQKALRLGARVRCFGEIRQVGKLPEIIHPEFQIIDDDDPAPLEHTLSAVYPTTEGLQQKTLKKLINVALEHVDELDDLLPTQLIKQYHFSNLAESLRAIHQPTSSLPIDSILDGTHPLQKRLVFEELIAHQLGVQQARHHIKQVAAPQMPEINRYFAELLQYHLPFKPTNAQVRVIGEIAKDLQGDVPMNRLVQGDVGSGKTLVALAAALHAIANGYQVALMAPTELLAEQHVTNFTNWFEPLGLEVVFISGQQTPKQRRRKVENLLLGIGHIAIGTHALFQKTVEFQQLGLIIIDEQHRFGVHQRFALREKGKQGDHYPHQLVMTATPIPRTLAMTAYGDLDYSVIDELPPNRQPITTVAITNERRDEIIERIAKACEEGRQVYWVCTLVEESEAIQCEAAEVTAEMLQERLPNVNVGLVHGRMHSSEKEEVMQLFKANVTQLLVATTVIEVGVDVPNASLMIIENAERLGLAQLHQLRGRVGRGEIASSCVLLYQAPLGKVSRKRLDAMRRTTDGFEIANIDLEIRGPGEVLGTKQTGDARLRIASLMRDQHMLDDVQQAARLIVDKYPNHIAPITQRWLQEADGEMATRLFQS